MKFFDITMPIYQGQTVYPGDPEVLIAPVSSISSGDGTNVSRLTLSTHTGTHLDPPRHFHDRGKSVDHVPLELLIGTVLVVDLPEAREIGAAELQALPLAGVERLLLKTGNSLLWESEAFSRDYACLNESGARYLRETGVKLVGIDYLSIERFDGDGAVHRLLLDHGVIILEGLNLTGVPGGHYELICLPLRIKGGDGAPVRAVLRVIAE
jgi:arylformamidase